MKACDEHADVTTTTNRDVPMIEKLVNKGRDKEKDTSPELSFVSMSL